MKRSERFGLTMASFALATVMGSAQSMTGLVQVTVDGNPVAFSAAQPTVMRGRVFVPLRGVFEQLGADVEWDQDSQTVTVLGNGRNIKLRIGSYDASVNGRVVTMDVAPTLIEDSTMVPLRFLSQSLGARVDWEPDHDLVAITTRSRAQRFSPPVQEPTPPIIVNPPPVVVPPPTVIVQPPPVVTPPPAPAMFIIHRDDVIPMRLEVDLSSNNNRSGDHFMAAIRADSGHYWQFPEGTTIEGFVREAVPASGSHGGTLDLRFTHIRFPNGHRYPVTGAVVPLNSQYVIRTSEGRFVARGGRANYVAQDAAIGAGAGLVVGAYVGKAVGGAAIGGTIGALIGAVDHSLGRNVIFHAGTRFGLVLGENLQIDRDDMLRE